MTLRTSLQAPLLTAALLATYLGSLSGQPAAPQAIEPAEAKLPAMLKAKALKPRPGDDALRKLLIARYNAAVAEMEARFSEITAGRATMQLAVEAADIWRIQALN